MSIKGNTVGTTTPRSDWSQTDPRKADYIKNKTRDIGASRLNNVEKAALAIVNGEGFLTDPLFLKSNNLNGFATWVYRQAGVNVSDYLGTVHSTFGKMFDTDKDADGYRFRKLTVEEGASPYCLAMLLEGSYSGKSANMQHYGYQYTLELKDYKVGDIFCMRYADTLDDVYGDSCYYMALYQAENTFILYQDFGPHEEKTNPSNVRVIDYEGLTDIINNAQSVYYYVLRPENIAIMPVMEAEERLSSRPRELNVCTLTMTEQNALASLSKGTPGKQVANLATWAYAQAKIDVSPYFTGDSISVIYRLLSESNYYSVMLVPDSKNKPLSMDKMRIGDIFCGQYKSSSGNGYWSAIYQGNNQFIKNEGGVATAAVITFDETNTIYDAKTWNYYYVLRPENIAIEDTLNKVPVGMVTRTISVTESSATLEEQIDSVYAAMADHSSEMVAVWQSYTTSLGSGSNWMMMITKTNSNYGASIAWQYGHPVVIKTMGRVNGSWGGWNQITVNGGEIITSLNWQQFINVSGGGSSASGVNREFNASPNAKTYTTSGIKAKFYILTIKDQDYANWYSVTIDYMSVEAAGGERSFTITRFASGSQSNNVITVTAKINSNGTVTFSTGGTITHICGYY